MPAWQTAEMLWQGGTVDFGVLSGWTTNVLSRTTARAKRGARPSARPSKSCLRARGECFIAPHPPERIRNSQHLARPFLSGLKARGFLAVPPASLLSTDIILQ